MRRRRYGHRAAVPVSAYALARSDAGWSGSEVDVVATADLDELTEVLGDVLAEAGAGVLVLLLEGDDEYCAVLRLEDGETRVFLSDVRVVDSSPPAALLAEHEDVAGGGAGSSGGDDDDDESAAARAAAQPVGDPALLSDLGVPSAALLDVVVESGLLPAEALDELAVRLGAGAALDEVRGAV